MNRSLKLFKVLYTRNISDSENGDIHLGVVRHAIMIYDNCGLTLDEHRRQLGEDWEKYTKNVSDIKVSLNYSKLPASLVYYSRSLKACTEIYRNCAKICFSDMGSFDQMDLMVDKLADLNTYNHYLGDIIFNDMNGLKITENSLYSSIYDTNNIQVAGWLIRLVAKDCISSSRMLNIIYDTLNYNNQSLGLVLSLFNLAYCIITRDSRSIDLYKLNKKV